MGLNKEDFKGRDYQKNNIEQSFIPLNIAYKLEPRFSTQYLSAARFTLQFNLHHINDGFNH